VLQSSNSGPESFIYMSRVRGLSFVGLSLAGTNDIGVDLSTFTDVEMAACVVRDFPHGVRALASSQLMASSVTISIVGLGSAIVAYQHGFVRLLACTLTGTGVGYGATVQGGSLAWVTGCSFNSFTSGILTEGGAVLWTSGNSFNAVSIPYDGAVATTTGTRNSG
jgi:hypothetical protein